MSHSHAYGHTVHKKGTTIPTGFRKIELVQYRLFQTLLNTEDWTNSRSVNNNIVDSAVQRKVCSHLMCLKFRKYSSYMLRFLFIFGRYKFIYDCRRPILYFDKAYSGLYFILILDSLHKPWNFNSNIVYVFFFIKPHTTPFIVCDWQLKAGLTHKTMDTLQKTHTRHKYRSKLIIVQCKHIIKNFRNLCSSCSRSYILASVP